MISMIRCSLARMSAASLSGGWCSRSSAALGFLTSRLQPRARRSAAGTFHARSFSARFFHHFRQAVNSSNWIGCVLV